MIKVVVMKDGEPEVVESKELVAYLLDALDWSIVTDEPYEDIVTVPKFKATPTDDPVLSLLDEDIFEHCQDEQDAASSELAIKFPKLTKFFYDSMKDSVLYSEMRQMYSDLWTRKVYEAVLAKMKARH